MRILALLCNHGQEGDKKQRVYIFKNKKKNCRVFPRLHNCKVTTWNGNNFELDTRTRHASWIVFVIGQEVCLGEKIEKGKYAVAKVKNVEARCARLGVRKPILTQLRNKTAKRKISMKINQLCLPQFLYLILCIYYANINSIIRSLPRQSGDNPCSPKVFHSS